MIPQLSAATMGTKLVVLGTIAALLIGLGIAGGLKWRAGEVATAQRKQSDAERDRDGWMATANDLRAAAAAQNEETRKAKASERISKAKADAAVAAANKAADLFLTRLAALNQQAKADSVKCEAERVKVCGAPLR